MSAFRAVKAVERGSKVSGSDSGSRGEHWEQMLRLEPETAVPDDLTAPWWVAHTRPRNEKALARELRALGVVCYLPLYRRVTRSRSRDRVSRSIVPVFPEYLFFNGSEEQRVRALRTDRIVSTLTVVDQRQLVGELRHIQRVIRTGAGFALEPEIIIGDWVRVIAGPLMGVEGVVRRLRPRSRVALNVHLLSQSVQVEVQRDLLEKIDAPSDVDE
jgi:transcriptional antiterminator NusG